MLGFFRAFLFYCIFILKYDDYHPAIKSILTTLIR